MAFIRTVRGDISPEALGITYMHEHLIGFSLKPDSDVDLRLDSEAAAAAELQHFRMAGGQAVVEMSPGDYNRNPLALKRLSEATDVHIVSVSGFIKGASADPLVADRSINQIADDMIQDICEGIEDTSICAGLLKAGSSLDKITSNEEKILRAAARAQKETGALISTHTEAGTMGLEQVELLRSEGVAPERILVGHTDRKLNWDYHVALANTGVTLGYDQFSKEKYYPDNERVEFVWRMIQAGYSNQITISCDLARRSDLTGYGGGPGYTFILWRIIPWLKKKGVAADDVRKIMIETPRRLLSIYA